VPALPQALMECIGTDPALSVREARAAVDSLSMRVLQGLYEQDFAPSAIDAVLRRHLQIGQQNVGPLTDVLRFICSSVVPDLGRTPDEVGNILAALDGRYVAAGPAGSPQRGMAHVLPTGRNFYTVDPRALPTPAAWSVGRAMAEQMLARYCAESGTYPEAVVSSIWGTPTMRTGGDDFAQALALLGVRPRWETESRRTLGFEVIPLQELGRPRIDVTLRVSGFFRDAFASLVHLFDDAVRAVARLDEPLELNFVRKHWVRDTQALELSGVADAAALAAYRVFGSKPGTYGGAVTARLEHGAWVTRAELADAAMDASGWVYGRDAPEGFESGELLRQRLSVADVVLHTLDTATQDLFSSNEVFEFQGGLIAAITASAAREPRAYVADTSNPGSLALRTLRLEAARTLRARVLNPKWHEAMRAHGYSGAAEMAATVDAVFGFSATTGIITDSMYEQVATALAEGENREFLKRYNVWALHAIAERLLEAQQRGLWDASPHALESLRSTLLSSEEAIEVTTEQV
jgi:cobaltochelatase CobN